MKPPTKTNTRKLHHRRLIVGALMTFGIALSAYADYSSAILAKSPKGYWQLNETNPVPQMAVAVDSSGTGANGTYRNGGSPIASPIAGASSETAVQLDGVSQYIEVPYNASLNPASALTVEAWVRPSTTTNVNNTYYHAILRSGGNGTGGGGFHLHYNAQSGGDAGIFKFALFSSAGVYGEIYNTNFQGNGNFSIFATNDVWFHVVGTWNSSDGVGHLYVNGVEMTNMNSGSNPSLPTVGYGPATASFLRIGADDTSPTQPWGNHLHPGGVAHVAIYNTQLSQSQVLAHYSAGTNAAANYAATVAADGPVGYWKLNESNIPALPVAKNLGTAGSALDGTYCFASTPGVAGVVPPNYGGFDVTNTAVYLTNTTTGVGDGGFVVVPPLRTLTDPTNLTIAALIKINGTQKSAASILGRRVIGSAKAAFQFSSSGTSLGYNWDDTGSQYNFNSGLSPADGVWTFAALVITPTNATIYMDDGSGLKSASNNNVTNVAQNAFTYQCMIGALGGNYANSTRGYNGAIDEVAVWTNSLTRQDILDLREAWIGSGLFVVQQPLAQRPTMLGGTVKFTVTPAGSTNYMPFTYQLKKDGSPVGSPSASSTLSYANVQRDDLTSAFTINVLTNGVPSALDSSSSSLVRWTLPGTYSGLIERMQPAGYYRLNTNASFAYEIAQNADAAIFNSAARTGGPQPTDQVGFEPNNGAFTIGKTAGYIATSTPVITNNAITVTAWVNPSSQSEVTRGIYFSRGSSGYAAFNFADGGGCQLDVTMSGNYNVGSSVFARAGVWNFVAMATTSTNVTFYCYNATDGWQTSTRNRSFAVPNLNGSTTGIGTDPYDLANRAIDGQIDEVAVFNRTLSSTEITQLVSAAFNVNMAIEPAGLNTNSVGWSYGVLQSAPDITGPWSPVLGATPPAYQDTTAGGQKFYRAQVAP